MNICPDARSIRADALSSGLTADFHEHCVVRLSKEAVISPFAFIVM